MHKLMQIAQIIPERVGRGLAFFFSSRRRHTRLQGDWSSDVCSSDLNIALPLFTNRARTQAGSERLDAYPSLRLDWTSALRLPVVFGRGFTRSLLLLRDRKSVV